MLETPATPFVTTLLSVGKVFDGKTWGPEKALMKEVTISQTFEEIEDQQNGRYCKVSGTYAASGAVTITVTGAGSSSAYIFTPGDVMFNYATQEKMLVATVASATTITVAAAGRAFGSTAAAAGSDGDSLFIIGNANEENGLARNVNSTLKAISSNYTQIFRTTAAASGSSLALKTYGGPDFEYQKNKKMIEHKKDLERSFIRGEKKDDTSGTQGKHRRTTGGVAEGIQLAGGLVQDQNGLLSAPDLEAFIREGFTYGNATKVLMCGGNVLSAVSEIARGQLRLTQGEKTYGLAINEWNSPHGIVRIVKNPTFVADQAAEAFLLDLECFKYRYLQGRDTFVRTNIQQPDMDGKIDEVMTEAGLERRTMARCAWLRRVSG